jgi:hypothetical protein
MGLKEAFNLMLSKQSREMTIKRTGNSPLTATIRAAPSNYSRNLDAPSDMAIRGKEFVISKEVLDIAGFPAPKRADRLIDSDLGTLAIVEVVEMYDIGASIIGYRVRTG